ncbi:hypothetical protein N803_12315 [Knoellia subterranea KCTC 19937]|uniref:ABC transporter permease n=1 Tax=Knoellia subterranea KCTC 19937 TaxID=1385521 RepID=A0A0A0JP52_9MICO|nr:hypothetical protein N803_12315 [Knoellia subterranea KCTC 19937]
MRRFSSRLRIQLSSAAIYSVVAGLAFAAVLDFWFGTLDGNYLGEAGAMAATIAAGLLAILGLQRILGAAGIGLGAALLMLLGNPLSGPLSALCVWAHAPAWPHTHKGRQGSSQRDRCVSASRRDSLAGLRTA